MEDSHGESFQACALRIEQDVLRCGFEFGSREHLASVQPLPIDSAVRPTLDAIMLDQTDSAVTPLELWLQLMRADPQLAAKLGWA